MHLQMPPGRLCAKTRSSRLETAMLRRMSIS